MFNVVIFKSYLTDQYAVVILLKPRNHQLFENQIIIDIYSNDPEWFDFYFYNRGLCLKPTWGISL